VNTILEEGYIRACTRSINLLCPECQYVVYKAPENGDVDYSSNPLLAWLMPAENAIESNRKVHKKRGGFLSGM